MTGLRERKKIAAWRAIRRAALHLFEEQGFETTTVEQIAAEAQVSRATFFNYFASKEATVFDQDPEAREHWRALMAARPADEPQWEALSAVLTEFSESLRDRMPLQRRLKQSSPALAQSTQDFGEQFGADLRAWVEERSAGDPSALLQLNLARAALATAYQTWAPDASFDSFLESVQRNLAAARPVAAAHRPRATGPAGAVAPQDAGARDA